VARDAAAAADADAAAAAGEDWGISLRRFSMKSESV